MASILRQIVAGPRARHPEAGLDLCYVTDFIIATSGPSQSYPELAYRNPLDQLVSFLDSKHGKNWMIWEFRAEGTGYPDAAVYDRIWHFPWPDHHPPPFRLVPNIMASMRNWLYDGERSPVEASRKDQQEDKKAALGGGSENTHNKENEAPRPEKNKDKVIVVHCKAGKGRSGTASCSFLIAEEGWSADDALARFTQRRMRPQFGAGVSIPSQVRYVRYVDQWTKGGKKYLDRPIEIVEIRTFGLRNGVRVDVEAFADEGKKIVTAHTFKKEERFVEVGGAPDGGGLSELVWDLAGYPTVRKEKDPGDAELSEAIQDKAAKEKEADNVKTMKKEETMEDRFRRKGANFIEKVSPAGSHQKIDKFRAKVAPDTKANTMPPATATKETRSASPDEAEPGGMSVVFRPSQPIRIENSDVNISVERRNRSSKSMGLTMVTAVGHVWWNAFFEGQNGKDGGKPADSGEFSVKWDEMDGIKGSSRKGTRALDRLTVVWRVADGGVPKEGQEIDEPKQGEFVPQVEAADWKGAGTGDVKTEGKDLGLRVQSPLSADVSRASSIQSAEGILTASPDQGVDVEKVMEGLKRSGPEGEDLDQQEKKGE